MKLDKLRGWGPRFAFASPACFFVALVLFVILTSSVQIHGEGQPPTFPGWWPAGLAIWLIILALSMISGLVVALDLEWIEHPRTHTGLTYVALASMAVATLAFLGVLLEPVLGIHGIVVPVTGFLFFGGLGLYLFLVDLVGLRARLLGQALPWLGMIAGVLFFLAALAIFIPPAGFVFLSILVAVPLYLAWSLWLGFKLRGTAPQQAAPAT